MPHFGLTEEQVEFRKWLHEFAEREIRPVAAEYDETEDFPWPVLKKAAELDTWLSSPIWREPALIVMSPALPDP